MATHLPKWQPIKIIDLARNLILLSGPRLRDAYADVEGVALVRNLELLLGFLLLVLGGQRLWVTGIAALAGSAGIFHVFVRYLDLPLPTASLGLLSRLGL